MSFIQYSMVQRSGCYGGSRNTNCQDSSDSKKSDSHRHDSPFNPQLHKTCAHFNPKAYRNLGKSGLRVSNIALGTLATFGCQITDEVAEDLITLAYDNGVNIFDTSEVYAAGKAEVTLGKILKKKNWRRSSYIVCTKIYWGGKAETEKGLSRKHIIEGLKGSLERLQLEYVDIIMAGKFDPKTPVEEVARAFTHVINMGWALYWGTSRWSPTEIMEIYSVCRQFNLIPPVVEQSEYNFFRRDAIELSMPELFQKIGLGLMAASPLAGGIISGKYRDEIPQNSRATLKGFDWLRDKITSKEGKKQQSVIKKLSNISDKLECTLSQLAIAWCLKNENVHCVVLGATSVEQLVEDLLSVQVISKLTSNILTEINDVLGTSFLTSIESLPGG